MSGVQPSEILMSDAAGENERRSYGNDQPLTLAESIRRKIAEAQAAGVRTPLAESGETGGQGSASTPQLNMETVLSQLKRNELKVGSTCGTYGLLKLIHNGNFAKIFESGHELLDRRLAVKVLNVEHASDTYMVKRLQEEARALSAIRSPHAVEVHDFGIDRTGHPYTVLELVQGPSLRYLFDSNACTPAPITMQVIVQIGDAFSDAHRHGIKYANLKPEHVLVEKSTESTVCVKLVDFFSACRDERLPPIEPSLDVAPYLSPEQFSGQPPRVQSDVYSLACLAFQMLTGALPFQENSLPDYAIAHTTKMHQKSDGLSDLVNNVFLKALDKDPGRRHQTVQEFVVALENAILGRN